MSTLLSAGVEAGSLRDGVTAEDILIGLSGMAQTLRDPAQRAQAGRLADLLLDGLRFGVTGAGAAKRSTSRPRTRSTTSSKR